MEEFESKESLYNREEVFSRSVRAGKRTYFFDVKPTKSNEFYLTITESKRKFNNDSGKFFYEKHKLFLYKEDFEKFMNGLNEVMEFIETGSESEETHLELETHIADVAFEDLEVESEI